MFAKARRTVWNSPDRVLAACALLCLGVPHAIAGQAKGAATFGTTVVIPSGLRGRIYFLRDGEAWLPDFSRLKPAGTIYTTSLNVLPQDWSYGFPGVTRRYEWFAIDYTGRFYIDTPGEYQFSLTSDDGSKLYIDDKTVINNDGQHAPETMMARIKLDCGIHSIRVSYFQGPRYQVALVLEIWGGKRKWRVFSTEEFKPPQNPEDWTCGGVPVPYDPNRRLLTETPGFAKEALEALKATPRPKAVAVQVAAYHFWQSAGGTQTSIVVGVPGTALSATRAGNPVPMNKLHLALLALTKGEDGAVVDQFSLDAPYEITDGDYEGLRAQGLRYNRAVHLPAGRYRVEAVVLDREARRAGTAEIAIESPPPRNGIGLSSLVLADRVEAADDRADAANPLIFEGKRVIPHLGPVDAETKPIVYFVVYPDSANPGKPAVRVQFLNGGQVLAEQTASLPAPDASGAIPMFIGVVTRPGESELRVTALQGDASATESLRYEVTGK